MARRKASKSKPRGSRSPRGTKSKGPSGLVLIGAGAAAWLVWSLTKPSTASAAETAPGSQLPAPGQTGTGSGSSASPTPQAPTPSSLLRRGSSGPAVLAWQTTLVYGGYLPDAPSSRDSAFGPLTEAATKVFQQKAGITVDGIVGPETRAAAARLISRPSP